MRRAARPILPWPAGWPSRPRSMCSSPPISNASWSAPRGRSRLAATPPSWSIPARFCRSFRMTGPILSRSTPHSRSGRHCSRSRTASFTSSRGTAPCWSSTSRKTTGTSLRPCRDRNEARRLVPPNLRTTAFLGDAFEEFAAWGVGDINPPHLIRHLDFPRAVKSPYELACLREANRLGARGHIAAAAAFEAGASEFEIELAFLAACGLREQDLPYHPIIAL